MVWLISSPTMITKMLQRTIVEKTQMNCRILPCRQRLPWKQDLAVTQRLLLTDCRGLQAEEIDALLPTRVMRQDCSEALFNVDIADQVMFERRALALGWQGIFYHSVGIEALTRGITGICRGEVWFRRDVLSAYALNHHPCEAYDTRGIVPLTKREQEVLSIIATGDSNDGISKTLQISQHTVKTHVYNIYQKIGVRNRLQAALWASRHL